MSKKALVILIVLSLFLLIFFSGLTVFAQNEVRVSKKLWVACPKNLVVFHILVMLSPCGEAMKQRYFHPLTKKARDHFSEFRNHPAVQRTDQMFKMAWYFVLNNIAFYYSEFPEAKRIREFPEEYKEWKSMEKIISDYITSVRDFYLRSRFENFWENHLQEIQAVMMEVKDNLPSVDIPQLMEGFYGKPVERFYFVPCPFMAGSATHVEINDHGKWIFYDLDGFQKYSDSFSNVYFAFHEFSHSFIEPTSRKYSEEINKLAYLYQPLKEDFQRLGYASWDRAFAEHMVTSGQLLLTRKAFGEEKAEKMLERESKQGFKLLSRFCDYFKEYEVNRGRFKDIEAFYPEILSRLSRLKVEEFRRPGILGFYPEYREDKLLIKDLVSDSVLHRAGAQKEDILFAIGKDRINSEESFNKAKEKWWNNAKEGDSVEIVILRQGKEIRMSVPVPFVTDYRYIERK
jgi:hypothetical protein